ncbi:MAG: PAS domain-containing protein [Candidatus Kapaibacterium sp.]|nr:MAG: PAS domain-containing protein [Candidatus Kapabacteria bacterium]
MNNDNNISQDEKEAELRFHAHRYATTSIGYCTISSSDGSILQANGSAARILGVSSEEFLGQRFVVFVCAEHRAAISNALTKVLSSAETPATCNVQLLRPTQQSPFWVHLEVFHHQNEPFCEIVITDISERKALEKAIHQHEMQMYSTLQAIPHGILILDATGTVQMCNSAAEKMLGLTASQIIEKHSPAQGLRAIYDNGKPIEEAANFLSLAPKRTLSPLAAVIKLGLEQKNITIGLFHLTSEVQWIAVHSRLLFPESEDGLRGTVISLTDITEQKRLERLVQGENTQESNNEASSPLPTSPLPATPDIPPPSAAPPPTTAARETDALYGEFVTIATATQGNIVLDAKKDILYLEGADDYTRFTTASSKEYTTFGSVGKWEQRLFAQGFLRVHRSTIVNFHAVHSWHFEDNIVYLNMRDGKQIRVSKGYKAYFLSYVR